MTSRRARMLEERSQLATFIVALTLGAIAGGGLALAVFGGP